MTLLDQLRSAAGRAGDACALLESPAPEALDACSTALESVAGRLASMQSSLPGLAGHPEALAEAWRLRLAVRQAAALLSHAADYHRRWQDLVGVMAAGYGPDGRPGEPPRPGRLSLRG